MIYIIHSDGDPPTGTTRNGLCVGRLPLNRPLLQARHYVGYCKDGTIATRLQQHRAGRSSKLLAALNKAGIGWQLVRVLSGDRNSERQLKKCKNIAHFCPACNPALGKHLSPPHSETSSHNYYNRLEISNSDLSIFKHLLLGIPYVIPQQAMRLGEAIHQKILEPENFDHKSYTDIDLDLVHWVSANFQNNAYCCSLLENAQVEQAVYWQDKYSLQRCRSKIDILRSRMLVDIKTTNAITEKSFQQACLRYEYDRQMAFYADAVNVPYVLIVGLSKRVKKIFFLRYRSKGSFLHIGRCKYQRLLNLLVQRPQDLARVHIVRHAYQYPISYEEFVCGQDSVSCYKNYE